ncbi:hypothetical protein PPERSA_09363 [Pseudocohnilembus persalinus]|uniref:Tetratricopeptide repeat protein n=1 Tax=Pseudocohnilembus persalinus TaxID=266149 RepID=A0A0V0QYK9_PSEPJ|nr:hypothetical protein PPERSA_09363 [Pseudocohnilembus persalinus]|eukprot:KRX07149.1 hypothetical protein PPERSA_09363 [Pseudocohnilembus persalinus]
MSIQNQNQSINTEQLRNSYINQNNNNTTVMSKQNTFNTKLQQQQLQQQNYQNKNEPNSKLLSLLDKMVNPVEQTNVDLFVDGVFSYPEDWLKSDEFNSFFTYAVSFMGLTVNQGKTLARQLTEKEQKEIEEQQNAKKKKKDTKKQDEPQLTPEQEEALRLQKEKEDEEERIRQEEWDALDEQEKFYRTQEDKYKSPTLYFAMERQKEEQEDQQQGQDNQQQSQVQEEEQIQQEQNLKPNQDKKLKSGADMAILDEKVYDEGGDWLYFCRYPNLTEEEIVKMKKGKPKNLNVNDLQEVKFRAWVDLTEFQVPGTQSIEQRCKLEQVIEDEENEDIPRPELKDTYIKIRIQMDPPVSTLIEEVQPQIRDIIPEAPPIPKQPATVECINEFKSEIQLAMESLALEYSNMFQKEMNANQEQKGKNTLTLQKKQEINKRKEQFIFDFNNTGKYKVLKERLKKSIVKICRDKFQKHGSITGIHPEKSDQPDQFYSELYVYLMEQTRQSLSDLIEAKKEELHEDIVTSYDQSQKERDRILVHLTKETPQQRLVRKANEYEMLNEIELSNKNLAELIASDPRNPQANYEYCQFLLRTKKFDKAEELLTTALSLDQNNQDYQFLMACLLMKRNRHREAGVFLRDLTEKHPSISLYNIAYSFLYQKFLQEQKLADKYKRITERVCLRRLGELQAKKSQKTSPNPFEIPTFKSQISEDEKQNKGPSLKPKQWDELVYYEFLFYLAKNNLFDLCEMLWESLYDPTTVEVQLVQCRIYLYNGDYNKCLDILNNLLEANPQNLDVIMMKAHICYITDKLYESEDIFLKALKQKEFLKVTPDKTEKANKLLSIYLRLGNIYLKRKSWGDAKAIFVRACELKTNSSLSWLGLGISCLRIGQYQESEEALNQANIYDPFSGNTWGYLALLCLFDGNGRFAQANQCLRELFKIEESCDLEILEELGDQLSSKKYWATAEKLYNKILELSEKREQTLENYGQLCQKLGETYESLKRYNESLEMYQEAKDNLEGENEKIKIEQLIENIKYYVSNPNYESL